MLPYGNRPHFEIDPEVHAMLDGPRYDTSKPQADDSLNQSETDTRSLLEKDLELFQNGIKLWKDTVQTGMVATKAEIPINYTFYTNTEFGPYSTYILEVLELQRRGSPIILCSEPKEYNSSTSRELISVYLDYSSKYHGYSSRFTIRGKFANMFESNSIFSFYFNEDWRKLCNFPDDETRTDDKVFRWAEQNGTAKQAFMAAYLSNLLSDNLMGREVKDSKILYEQFAAEKDSDGIRKNLPLSIEAFNGLVISNLHSAFTSNPELNEQNKLTRPFLPIKQDS